MGELPKTNQSAPKWPHLAQFPGAKMCWENEKIYKGKKSFIAWAISTAWRPWRNGDPTLLRPPIFDGGVSGCHRPW